MCWQQVEFPSFGPGSQEGISLIRFRLLSGPVSLRMQVEPPVAQDLLLNKRQV